MHIWAQRKKKITSHSFQNFYVLHVFLHLLLYYDLNFFLIYMYTRTCKINKRRESSAECRNKTSNTCQIIAPDSHSPPYNLFLLFWFILFLSFTKSRTDYAGAYAYRRAAIRGVSNDNGLSRRSFRGRADVRRQC